MKYMFKLIEDSLKYRVLTDTSKLTVLPSYLDGNGIKDSQRQYETFGIEVSKKLMESMQTFETTPAGFLNFKAYCEKEYRRAKTGYYQDGNVKNYTEVVIFDSLMQVFTEISHLNMK